MAAAIASANNGDTIKLTGPINANIVLNKLVNIDLNGQTLTGNVSVNSTTTGTLNISSGTITGSLTVNAPNATVNNAASVTAPGVITITDVATGTWNENANGNTIIVNDSTGITFNIGNGNTVSSLTLNQPTTVTVGTGATVSELAVSSGAGDSTITNNGTVTNLKAEAAVEVTGNSPETVTGSASNEVAVTASVGNHAELIAALTNTKITNILIDGTIGSADNFGEYNIDRAVTVKGAENNKVYGTFNIKVTGVKLEGLNLFVRGGSATPATLKTGVNILTNEATIKNNVFELLNPNSVDVGNGLSIWSTTAGQTQFDISGNTFKSFQGNSSGWSSTAILVVEGLDMARFDLAGTLSKEISVNDYAIATENEYIGGTYAYMHHKYSGENPGVSYGYARTSGNLGAIIRDASDGATVLLANDITRNTDITVSKNITLTGGYKVTLADDAKITVLADKELTINEGTSVDGTIAGDGTWTGKQPVEPESEAAKALAAIHEAKKTGNWSNITVDTFNTAEGIGVTEGNLFAVKDLLSGLPEGANISDSEKISSFVSQIKVVVDSNELQNALDNAETTYVYFANNITTDKQIIASKSQKEIFGGGNTLSAAEGMTYTNPNNSVFTVLSATNVAFIDLTIDAKEVNIDNLWGGVYALQVYNSTNINLHNVTLKNGDGGLLVNGSTIIATNIKTFGNEFGGIEVSKGTADGLKNSSLTVQGNSVHNDSAGMPAIWVYTAQGTLTSELYEEVTGGTNGKQYYNLKNN